MNRLPLVRDLMPVKNFAEAYNFVSMFGQILDVPYKTKACGCIGVYLTVSEKLLWLDIATCPICKIKEDIQSHRDIYDI